MATADAGLFGPSPWEALQMQQKAEQDRQLALQTQASNFAQLNAAQRGAQGMFTAGGQLGNMLNPQPVLSPAVQQAMQMQGALKDGDVSSPEGYIALAQKVKDFNPALALQLVAKAKAMQKEQAAADLATRKQDTLDAAQLSTSTLQAAQAAKALRDNPNLITTEVGVKGKPGWMQKILYDKTGKEESVPIGEPYQTAQAMKIQVGSTDQSMSKQPITYVDPATGQAVWGTIADAKGKPAAVYDPNTRALVSGAQTGGKTGSDLATKDFTSARVASVTIPKIDTLINQLETGDVSTGTAAELRLGLNKAVALLGGKDALKSATDTEIADAMMGSEVFPLIQSLGIGAKGMDTPAERQFMRSVLTGSLNLEKGTLLNMAKMRKADLKRSIDTWDASVDNGSRDLFFQSTQIPKTKFGKQAAPTKTVKWGDLK